MSVYEQLRPDGRDWNQLRPVTVEINPLSRSDGSAKVSCGSTSVVAGVTGPVESKMNQQSIELLIRPSNGVPKEKHRLLEDQVTRILREMISVPPGCTVGVYCEVLLDDGSVSAALVNAVSLALIAAGVSMSGTPLAVSYAFAGERILLDCCGAEEKKYGSAVAVPTMVFDAVSGKVMGVIGNSVASRPSVFEALTMGSAAVAEMLEIARSHFRSHLATVALPRK